MVDREGLGRLRKWENVDKRTESRCKVHQLWTAHSIPLATTLLHACICLGNMYKAFSTHTRKHYRCETMAISTP